MIANVWRPLSEAKRDGTPYLLKMTASYKGPFLEWDASRFGFKNGLIAVFQNNRDTWSVPHDSGWQFAAPVGVGGFQDELFVGFMEIPE